LSGSKIIASAHIRCHNLNEYMHVAKQVKDLFHQEGIRSTTIQPEFIDVRYKAFLLAFVLVLITSLKVFIGRTNTGNSG